MPFIGSAAVAGSEYISNAQTARAEPTLTVVDGALGASRTIDVTGMSRAVVRFNQSGGAPGSVVPRVYIQGNASPLPYPAVLVAALNQPQVVSLPISARAMDVVFMAPGAGGPHTIDLSIMVSAASGA